MGPGPSSSGASGELLPTGSVWPTSPWLAFNNVYVGEMLHHRLLLEQGGTGRKSSNNGHMASESHIPHHQCSSPCSICSLNL
ncbi:hypothetical protein R5R35_002678 [Gryllus longicercus]|uniref:Uncharacterized protein n=1 Tax=Gryllus longicercus TaxID=2509291 RepID=A0AAN9VW28_9ORTH